jgi:hypothetical protein
MIAWGRAFIAAINRLGEDKETGLMKMFRIEYSKEYHWMKKNGQEITDGFVKTFLEEKKQH